MSFLSPLMLWGALAAAIPIALHFFYKSRHRDVRWGAMKFLLAAVEQTSRRLRFQELLLLLLRIAVLLLLALALARPTSVAGRGAQGEAVDAVLILDNSLSMGARAGVAPPADSSDRYRSALREFAAADGSLTCFDRARAAATALVASLPPHSTVQVLACADRAIPLGPRVPSQLDQALPLIAGLKLSSRRTDYLAALREAVGLLERGPSPNKELYLLGDMQRAGFGAQDTALAELAESLRGRVHLHFVHCAPQKIRNVAIVGITPQTALRGGERGDFAVLLRNAGKEAVRDLTVTLEANGDPARRDSQALAEVGPGEARAAVLSLVLDRPGRHVLTATARPDDLDGDNRLDQIIHVPDRVGVLLIDGAPDARNPQRSASYFLQHALDPGAGEVSRLPVTVVAADRASPQDLGGKELCLLVNARVEPRGKEGGTLAPEFLRALAAFVQEGKPLVIIAGDRVAPEVYNRVLFEQLSLSPYRIVKVEKAAAATPWTLDRGSAEEAPFRRFRDGPGYAGIDRVGVRQALALEDRSSEAKALAEESRVLLRYSNGLPAIASRKRPGQGEVILFTTSMNDPAWSDWFLTPAFVPFVQVLIEHLLEGRPQAFNRTAGETLEWEVPAKEATTAFDLVMPGGDRLRLSLPQARKGRWFVSAPDLAAAGVYGLVPAGQEAREDAPVFAVAPDLRETEDLEYLQPADLDARLQLAAIHTRAGDDGTAFSAAARLKREWTPWLLGLLLALVLAEMLFAWYCGRSW